MRSMLPDETHSTATRRPLPNDFDLVDLHWVQVACRSARTSTQMGLTGETWAGSRRARPGRPHPHVPRLMACVLAGCGQLVGRLLLLVPWALRLWSFEDMRRGCCTRWRVCRRRVNGGRPQHLLNVGVDLATTVGRPSHVAMASWWCEPWSAASVTAAALSQDPGQVSMPPVSYWWHVGFDSPWVWPSGLEDPTPPTATTSFQVRLRCLEPRLPARLLMC